ncbi:MAG: hypothetical protein HYW02_03100 [Deltaproteobacteria bacterium]|nr:hypothetical protein [Deltaproteobacteria bacterium]
MEGRIRVGAKGPSYEPLVPVIDDKPGVHSPSTFSVVAAAPRSSATVSVPAVLSDSVPSIDASAVFRDWNRRGLKVSVDRFHEQAYGFEVQSNPQFSQMVTPFHKVNLKGHADLIVPWSDPYLLMEWESVLIDAGAGRQARKEGNSLIVVYSFKGRDFLKVTETPENVSFLFIGRSGQRLGAKTVLKPEEREVLISKPAPVPADATKETTQSQIYKIHFDKDEILVETYFPASVSEEKRFQTVSELALLLQALPSRMVLPFFQGEDGKLPLLFVLAPQKTAESLKVKDGNPAGGNYNYSINRVWIDLDPEGSMIRSTFLHEVTGHGTSDFFVPSNENRITEPDRSGLRDYYALSLQSCLTPQELANYMELSRLIRNKEDFPKVTGIDWKVLESRIEAYRTKGEECFVSGYAIEGSDGIREELNEPHEDFAEVREAFYSLLLREKPDLTFHAVRRRDKLLSLVGLLYLFEEYGVPSLGDISREDLFLRESFQKVLGVTLKPVDPEKVVQGVPIDDRALRWVLKREAPLFQLQLGLLTESIDEGGRERSFQGLSSGLRLGKSYGRNAFGLAFLYGDSLSNDGRRSERGRSYTGALWWDRNFGSEIVSFVVGPAIGARKLYLSRSEGDPVGLFGAIRGEVSFLYRIVGLYLQADWTKGYGYEQEGFPGGTVIDFYRMIALLR